MRGYKRCNACRRVFDDPGGKSLDAALPCPMCGKEHRFWGSWPIAGVLQFLRIARSQNRGGDGRLVALVFTCTAVELLLEDIVEGLVSDAIRRGSNVGRRLRRDRTVNGREKLFQHIRGKSLKEVIETSPFTGFYRDWQRLREERNRVVHGDYYAT